MKNTVSKTHIHHTGHTDSLPKISVAIISYNNAAYIDQAIESILSQTLEPHEIIIQDDCSTDTSWEIILEYTQKYPNLVKSFQHPHNKGIAANFNSAINNCCGDLLTWVAGDDRFHPDKLATEWAALKTNAVCRLAYSNVVVINAEGIRTGIWDDGSKPAPPSGNIFLHVFSKRLFPKRRNLYRNPLLYREVFEAVGPFDESLSLFEDYDWKLRAAHRYQAVYTGKPLVEYRIHDKGVHNSPSSNLLKNIRKVFKKNCHFLDTYPIAVSNAVKKDTLTHIAEYKCNTNIQVKTTLPDSIDRHDQLIFLISQPRAGSTLLQRVLGCNDHVFTASETWLMLHPLYALKSKRIQTEFESQHAETALRDLLDNCPEREYLFYEAVRRYALTFYNRALENSKKSYFLDKTPRYYMVLQELYRVFPNAHYVFLFRNPMAVLSSMLKTWFKNNPQSLMANRNYQDLTIAPKQILEGIDVIGNKASIIHYEHLVKNPRQTIQNLCNRLGLIYHDDMLYYGRKPFIQGRLGDPVGVHQNDHPVTENIEKWVINLRTPSLKDFGKRVLKEIGRDTIGRMGYDMDAIQKKLDETNHQPEKLIIRHSDSKFTSTIANADGSILPLPVVICQMGKVGSTSLMTSLNASSIANQQIHFLSPKSINDIETYYRNINQSGIPDHLRRSREIYHMISKTSPGNKWKIISLVRDPIARAISSVFQNMSDLFPGIENCESFSALDQIETHLLHQFKEFDENSDFACTWFDKELKAVFGFDIFQHPFNKDRGYDIFKTEKADFLVLRTENLTASCSTALKEFLKIESFELSNNNVGRKKPYRNLYEQLLNNITIPADTLNRIYGSRFVRHFYKNSEIVNFKKRWQKSSPPTQFCLSRPIITAVQRYPKITIVTPSFNQAEYLEACIQSILNQKYPNLEYIIMDGGSTDGSVDIIKKYANNLYYWQSQPDGGHYAAVNQGFAKSSGNIMAWLNSDDLLHDNALFKVAHLFESNPDVEWILGRYTIWNAKGIPASIEPEMKRWERKNIIEGDFKWIQQESSFWKRSLWYRAGGSINTHYDLAGDLDLWCRFFRYSPVYRTDALIGGYRIHGNQRAQLHMSRYISQANRIISNERQFLAESDDKNLIPAPEPLFIESYAFGAYTGIKSTGNMDKIQIIKEDSNSELTESPSMTAYNFSQNLLSRGKVKEAEIVLQKIIQDYPKFALAYNDLGVLHCNAGRKDQALTCYQQAVNLDPYNITFRKNLAEFLFVVKKDIQGALKIYIDLLESNRNDTELLYGIGQICLSLGEKNDSKKFFQRILELDPKHSGAAEALRPDKNIIEDKHLVQFESKSLLHVSEFRVSAVVSTFASERFIKGRLQNLVDQSLFKKGDLEIIVVDSNSPEKEHAVVKQFCAQYPNIRYLRTPERETVYTAWNRGIEMSHGTYFVNANTDDRFSVDALEVMANSLDEQPDYDAAYGNWVVTRTPNDTFDSATPKHLFVYPQFNPGLFFYLQITSHASFIRRSVFKKIGNFDGFYTVFGDREFMFRFASAGFKALKLQKTIGLYLENPTSVERANKEIGRNECIGLYDHYLTPELFAALNGYESNASAKELSLGYTWVGCFGMGLYDVAGSPVHALKTPARLFPKAIELDPKNVVALNNLGVVTHHLESPRIASEFFTVARSLANSKQAVSIDHNLKLTEQNVTDPNQFKFLFPPDFQPIMVVEAPYENRKNISAPSCVKNVKSKSDKNLTPPSTKRKRGENNKHSSTRLPQETLPLTHAFSDLESQIDQTIWRDYLKENYSAAASALSHVLQKIPDHWPASALLVDVMLQAGQEAAFPEHFRFLEEHSDLPPQAIALIGSCYEATGNLAKAAQKADMALALDATCARAWNLKGVLAYRNGKIDEAKRHFERAVDSDAAWGEPWTNLGTIDWEQGQHETALKSFEKGFHLSPAAPNVATTYHIAVIGTEQYESAKPLFEKTVKRHPDFRKARFLLIDILIRMEAYQEALIQIEAALVRFGTDPQMLEAAMAIRGKVGPMSVPPEKHPSLSLCMIVRNEEKYLPRCLKSLKPVVDEMIVVDTGSRDATRNIAEVFGARVFDFEWRNDFSAARNFSLAKAAGDWILVIDADEVIATQDHENLIRHLIENKLHADVAFMMLTRNYTAQKDSVDWIKNAGEYPEETSNGWIPSRKVRLFRNHQGVHFVFPVHEQVDPVLNAKGVSLIECPIPVHHYGKLDHDRTLERWHMYYEIGKQKLKALGKDKNALKEMAVQAGLLLKWDEAAIYWKKYLKLNPAAQDAYMNLTRVMAKSGDFKQANHFARKAFDLSPGGIETLYNLALSELQIGQAEKAAETASRMAKAFPENSDGLVMRAVAMICAGNMVEGSELFKNLLKKFSKNSIFSQTLSIIASIRMAGFDNWITKLVGEFKQIKGFPHTRTMAANFSIHQVHENSNSVL